MSKAMTAAEFSKIVSLFGFNLETRGHAAKVCRMLGVDSAAVSAAKQGRVSKSLAEAAREAARAHAAAVEGGVSEDSALADYIDVRTDEERLADINDRFETMGEFVNFAIEGMFESVLVTGPGGIGKTHPIEEALREYEAQNPGASVVCVSGAISAVGLVEAAWNTQNKGDVLLIDDADGGLAHVDFLNVLKAMTDSKGRRVVSWMKQNKALAEAGVEPQFEYNGSVIIISNANLTAKAENGNGHIDAILSRAMHIDLGINDSRDLALRVGYMIEEVGMFAQLFAKHGMADAHDTAAAEISAFIKENNEAFRSLTLREASKIAKMYIAAAKRGSNWQRMARLSLGMA